MWIFEFLGIDYPRKTYHAIDFRELIFFECENDQVHEYLPDFAIICRFRALRAKIDFLKSGEL